MGQSPSRRPLPPTQKRPLIRDSVSETRNNLCQATKHMAFRRAAAVAIASIQTKIAASERERGLSFSDRMELFVEYHRQLMELKLASMEAELKFFEALSAVGIEAKESTIFKLFDRDASGTVDARELTSGFQKMDQTKAYAECFYEAQQSLARLDVNNDGELTLSEFKGFLKELQTTMHCSADELAELLILWLSFRDDGKTILQDAIDDAQEGPKSKKFLSSRGEFRDEVVEIRSALLFQMMDYEGKGKVDFRELVKRLYHLIRDIDPNTRTVLFMMNDEDKRTVDYAEFVTLLFNVVAVSKKKIRFHDVADAITLATCRQHQVSKEDMIKLFHSADMYTTVAQSGKTRRGPSFDDDIDDYQYGRINTLFTLWDLDHSEYIEYSEFVLGLRKFQNASRAADATIDEGMAAILHFDADGDQKLDRDEFASFLSKFAKSMNLSLNDLIDFMVVQSALKDSDENERAYVETMTKRLMSKKKQQKRNIWSFSKLW